MAGAEDATALIMQTAAAASTAISKAHSGPGQQPVIDDKSPADTDASKSNQAPEQTGAPSIPRATAKSYSTPRAFSEKDPKKSPTNLDRAIDAGLIAYQKRHGTSPTDSELFHYLAIYDQTDIITELDDEGRLEWRLSSKNGYKPITLKGFQNHMSERRKRIRENPG